MFQILGFSGQIANEKWPKFDPKKCEETEIEIVLQVNGKIKSKLQVLKNTPKEEILKLTKQDEKLKDILKEKEILKSIYVENRLINLIVK